MRVLSAIFSGAFGLAGVVAWFLPDVSIKDKIFLTIICVMLVTIVQLIFAVILKNKAIKDLSDNLAETEKQASDIDSKHSALAEKYDLRRTEIKLYQCAIDQIGALISLSVVNTKEAKLNAIFSDFIAIKNDLIRSVDNALDSEPESDQNH